MLMKDLKLILLGIILAAGMLSGCTPPQPAGLSNEQVGQAADSILKALNSGNYQDFTKDFSTQMINAFSEAEFNKLRDMLSATSGNYVSGGAPRLVNTQGVAVYVITYKYEKENVTVTLSYQFDGKQVEGLFFDSQAIRKYVAKQQ